MRKYRAQNMEIRFGRFVCWCTVRMEQLPPLLLTFSLLLMHKRTMNTFAYLCFVSICPTQNTQMIALEC